MNTQPQFTSTAPKLASTIEPWQRHQRETAGHQFETEQHDGDEADREDQRADQRLAGLHRAGEGKARRDAQNGARQHAADQEVARRQRQLALAGLKHRHRDIGRLHVIHLLVSRAKLL